MSNGPDYSAENLRAAEALKREVESWVNREFNFIQLEVYEVMANHESSALFEHIDAPNPEDWAEEYAAENPEEIREEAEGFWQGSDEQFEEYDTVDEYIEGEYGSYAAFAQSEMRDAVEEFSEGRITEYYPMWNTLFECRDKWFADRLADAAKKVGLGKIEAFGPFNTTFFAMSAGHSFYGQYWIPMYLSVFPEKAKEWEGVDYSMV